MEQSKSMDTMDSYHQAVLILQKNCHFLPLKQKLGRLTRYCCDMGELMTALTEYADSDSTKDPCSNDEKSGKGKKNNNGKAAVHNNPGNGGQINNGKRNNTDDGLDLVANTSVGGKRHGGNAKPPFGGSKSFDIEAALNRPCPNHGTDEKPVNHAWKDCFVIKEFQKYSLNRHRGNNNGPRGCSGSGSQGGGGSGFGNPGQGNNGQYHVFTPGS